MTNDSNDSAHDTIPCPPPLAPYSDAEFDDAMRELEAIEAAERDLAALRQYWARKSVGLSVNSGLARLGLYRSLSRLFAAGGLVACMLFPGAAQAEETQAKVKRPTMCLQGQPVSGQGFAGFICLDGKRPRIFTRYIVVQFVNEHGKPASYVLGWTAPVKRTAKGGFVAEGTPVKPGGTVKL